MGLNVKFAVLFLVVVVTAAFGQTGTPNTDWYTADPTADVFYISTADELAGLAVLVNKPPTTNGLGGKTIMLMDDIDLSSYSDWTPIGGGGNVSFNSIFDGNGKVVKNLKIDKNVSNVSSKIGLFGSLWQATVKNLGVVDADVNVDGGGTVGGVAGEAIEGSFINNCYFSGTVRATGTHVGGIVGEVLSSNITNCYTIGNVSGSSNVGGVAGSVIKHGALVDAPSNITNCYATGSVSGHSSIGGVVGSVTSGNVTNCYATGNVSGLSYVSTTGSVIGSSSIGGVVGSVTVSDVANCYSTGDISGGDAVGGVVGSAYPASGTGSPSSISNCYATGNVSGSRYNIGGVVGAASGGNVTNCVALNPRVGGVNDVGRISGSSSARSSLNNFAYANMELILDNIWGSTYMDGTDITPYEIRTDGTLLGLFTDTDVWTIVPGKLPGLLGKAVDLPEHLQTLTLRLRYNATTGGRLIGDTLQWVDPNKSGSSIVALANDMYAFESWSDGVTTAERTDTDVSTDINVTAKFVATQHTLNYSAGSGGKIIGTSSQIVLPGGNGEKVTAVPNDGYRFERWSDGVTTTERTDENVMRNISVTAMFTLDQYTLRYVLGVGGSSLIGGAAVQTVKRGDNGEEVYVTAISGNTFVRWNDGLTDNPRQDKNVISNKTVMACFADADGNELDCDEYVSIKTADRTIPTIPNKDAVVVMPMPARTLSFEITAGPNPIRKSDGVIKFFCQGARVNDGALTIYDATGNVVSKITVCDNAVLGSQAKRQVGSWDLTYSNGKRVATGTYLVRGSLKTADGKKEKVSLLLGVR